MKKKWLQLGFFAAIATSYCWLWFEVGDPEGAFWSLILLWLGIALLAAVFGFLFTVIPALILRMRGVSDHDHLVQLEASGKAVRKEFETKNALTVQDLSTSGIMHFVDVGNGNILCLSGQHYFEFEPIDDDPELNQARRFPTEKFTLLCLTRTGEVLVLFPGDSVIEPTVLDPVVRPQKLFDLGFKLRDGEIASNTSLDEIERVLSEA